MWKVLFSVGTSGAVAPPEGSSVTASDLLHARTFVIDEIMTVQFSFPEHPE